VSTCKWGRNAPPTHLPHHQRDKIVTLGDFLACSRSRSNPLEHKTRGVAAFASSYDAGQVVVALARTLIGESGGADDPVSRRQSRVTVHHRHGTVNGDACLIKMYGRCHVMHGPLRGNAGAVVYQFGRHGGEPGCKKESGQPCGRLRYTAVRPRPARASNHAQHGGSTTAVVPHTSPLPPYCPAARAPNSAPPRTAPLLPLPPPLLSRASHVKV
jgi:hypothetical protein